MAMERLDPAKRLSENQDPTKQFAIEQAKHLLSSAGVKDPGPKSEATTKPVFKGMKVRDMQHVDSKPEITTFSRDQLIVSSEPSREALALLKKAERVGLGRIFAVHRLSDVRLTRDTQVPGWDKKPEQWYWDQIAKGNISKDAAKLPGAEVLIDTIKKPNYKNGKQLHENDPLALFLRTLRKDKKLLTIKDIPDTSRFGIPPDELYPVVFAEMANRLEHEVRLPIEIEFNVLGNFVYPHFGEANTAEWLHDNFGISFRLVGGHSDGGGLVDVYRIWSDAHRDNIAFRPLVVVSPKA